MLEIVINISSFSMTKHGQFWVTFIKWILCKKIFHIWYIELESPLSYFWFINEIEIKCQSVNIKGFSTSVNLWMLI